MKILIADDHAIVREGLKQYIKTLNEVNLIEEADEGIQAWTKIQAGNHDLVILDVSMPGMSGLDILRNMKQQNIMARVLILSVHPQEQYAIEAYRFGASGYLSKDSAYEELTLAIKKIASGVRYFPSSLVEKLAIEVLDNGSVKIHQKLSKREYHVMLQLAKGKSVTEIAREINLSDKTISTYRSRILKKMNLLKNAELTIYAIRNNLIS